MQAYQEYLNLVGDTDGGRQLLSEAEYNKLRTKAATAKENEFYVYWVNPNELECKAIGPSSTCFCGHRYRDHAWTDTHKSQVHCRMARCDCPCFYYIPVHGSLDLKCSCKHSYSDHQANTKACKKKSCQCDGFSSTVRCGCGFYYSDHKTLIETKSQRVKLGKQVRVHPSETLAPLGGLTGMTSLLDGHERAELMALEYQSKYKALEEGTYSSETSLLSMAFPSNQSVSPSIISPNYAQNTTRDQRRISATPLVARKPDSASSSLPCTSISAAHHSPSSGPSQRARSRPLLSRSGSGGGAFRRS